MKIGLLFMSLANTQDYDDYEEFDMEHRRGGSEIEFLKDDVQYANKVDLAFDRLFEGAQSDSEYLDNQRALVLENEKICADGDKNGNKVVCSKKNGKIIKNLSYFTPARKHKQMKLLTLWLQEDTNNFGRFRSQGQNSRVFENFLSIK